MCGDYILRVQVCDYSNPSNRCGTSCNGGCCDNFDSTIFCFIGDNECDNEFFFCVRPLEAAPLSPTFVKDSMGEDSVATRAGTLGCLQPPAAYRTNTNFGANQINFFSPTFLGVPNPLEFSIDAARWEVSSYS